MHNTHCRFSFCESGSRAWGFPSPDSDYDVRFIYAHRVEWHLHLEKKNDTIDLITLDNVDLSGWELRKTLQLFAGCNLPLNEWLGSPIVYAAQAGFHEGLHRLIPEYFNPRKALFHYLSMSKIASDEQLVSNDVSIKKFFYALRCVLACRWITESQTMPPTEFDELAKRTTPSDLAIQIGELKLLKSQTAEKEKLPAPKPVVDWLISTRTKMKDTVDSLPTQKRRSFEPLNKLMLTHTPGIQPRDGSPRRQSPHPKKDLDSQIQSNESHSL